MCWTSDETVDFPHVENYRTHSVSALRMDNVKANSYRKLFLAKSPLEKWLSVKKVNIALASLFGLECMEVSYKPSYYLLTSIYLLSSYFILLIYTFYYYRNNPLRALQATPAIGIYIPGLVIFLIALIPSSRKQLRHLYNFVGDYIYANSIISSSNHCICDRMAIDLIKSILKILGLFVISFSVNLAAVSYKNLVRGEIEMPLPVILPFIDPDTKYGYIVNLGSQMITLNLGMIVFPAAEIVNCIFKNTVLVTAAVIENALLEFKKDLSSDEKFTSEQISKFRNIIMKILDFNRFVRDFDDVFYWKFFLQPVSSVYAVTMSIFLYVMSGWITGLSCAFCCYVQLIILCDIGRAVEDASDIIEKALNRFPFYIMPSKKQEMFSLILMRAQKGAKIGIGPLTELNYMAATKMTKMIYTYIMFMLRE